MAAQGTGLPTAPGAGLTPNADMSSSGAGERATAQALAQAGEGLGRLQRQVLSPLLERKGRDDANKAVAEGRFDEQLPLTEYGTAYSDALRSGTLARMATEDDRALDMLQVANPYNPEGFAASAEAHRSAVLKDTPGVLATQRALNFDRRRDTLQSNLALAQVQRNVRASGTAAVSRAEDLTKRIARTAEDTALFNETDARFSGDLAELDDLYGQIVENPMLGISRDAAERSRADALDSFQAAAISGHVRRVYRQQGAAAALAEIQALLPPVIGPEVTTPSAGPVQGLVEPGNIDLASRPSVANPDGTVSTVRSISIERDGQTYLIPTVTDDGRVVSDDQAVELFEQTGRHLGVFDSEASAHAYAQVLHEDQAQGLAGDPGLTPTGALSAVARDLAYDRAMAAYAEEAALAQQQATIVTAARTQAGQRAEDLMTSMRYGAEVDPDELRRLAAESGDPGLVARARWALEVGVQPPEGFGGSGGSGSYSGDVTAAGGFAGAVDFVIDQLEGGDAYVADDNGRGPTRFGINATANPDLDIQNLTRPGAVARYRRDYWDAIGADQLPPALALIAFDAAVNQGPADARRWIAESGGDPARYLALREADYRDLAARDPRHRPHLQGWLSRLENVRQRAARVQAFQNNADGFASDPISFALGNANRPALAAVSPLPVNAVFSPDTVAAWGQAIQARRATGTTLAQQYQVPMRYLTDGEAEAYKDQFERDPASVIAFARAATGALGGQGARDLLAEVGQGGAAPVLIHIGDLARPGGDGRFAAQAAQGLALKATGQTLPTEDRDEVAAVIDRYRTSFRSSASLLAAVQQSAEAAALGDRATGRMREPEYYGQAAMGRTTWGRHNYGGGGVVNGVTVVVPRWLNPDYFDDALEALASAWATQGIGPVYSGGDPMPAREVRRLRPVLMADGRYRLVDRRGRSALTRSGAPYDVNMDAGRDFLRQRLGAEAVRP